MSHSLRQGTGGVRSGTAAICLIAVGTLGTACAEPAASQSTVTIYGAVDASLEFTSPGRGYVARVDSGAYRGSRIGVRGAEDIGGGLRILFTLENGFDLDDGALATANTLFNRQAWIGVAGDFGTVRVGRQYSPIYIPFKGQLDAFGAGTIASGLNNLSKITPYQDNAITYLSPELGGVSVAVQVALRNAADGNGNGLAGSIGTLSWRGGPWQLSYAHQQTRGAGALRANLGGVSYAWDKLTLFLSYFNGDGGSPRYHNDGLSASGRYALSARLRGAAGYTYLRDRTGGNDNAEQFSAGSEYDLSKTVLLYASAGWLRNHGQATFTLRGVNVTGVAPSAPGATVRGVQLGMIMRF